MPTPAFLPLLVVILLAFVVPLGLSRLRRLRLPIVVGEILAGVIVGKSGLGWVQPHDPVLELLSEFGLVFLMFLSGMELDFSALGIMGARSPGGRAGAARARGFSPLQLAGFSFALTLVLATLVGVGLQAAGLVRSWWMMGLVLSTTSLGVVMPVLKERGLLQGRYGQALLTAALLADLATMLLITVGVALLAHGLTLNILLIGLLFVAFFLVYHFGLAFSRRLPGLPALMQELSHASAQIKVRASFTVMLMFVVLSETLGTEIILGAFLAGAIISLMRTPDDADLGHKLEAIGFGFFIPVFFVSVGADFDLAVLLNSREGLLLVPLLLVAAALVKIVPALLFRLSFSWRQTLAAGALLSARLSLIIAASAVGLRLGVISPPVNAAVILVALLSVTLAPLVFTRLAPPAEASRPPLYVVVGAGDLGLHVARRLEAHQETVVILEADPARVARARQAGLRVEPVPADVDGPEVGRYFEQARTIICTSSDTAFSLRVCQLARAVYGVDHLVARVDEPAALANFQTLGVVPINPALDQAALLVLLARNPAAYALLTETDDETEVVEVPVENAQLAGLPLRAIAWPQDILVLAIRRAGDLLVPHGRAQVQLGDHLTLAGSVEAVPLARQLLAANGAPRAPS